MIPGIMPVIAEPALPIEVAEVGTASSGSGATSYNFPSVNFGAEAPNRLLIFAIHAEASSSNRALITGTIGGVPATIVDSGGALDTVSAFMYAVVPTGTSGAVAFTFSNSVARAEAWGWQVLNLQNSTHYDQSLFSASGSGSSISQSVTAVDESVAFSALTTAAAGTFTFDNMVRRYTSSLNGAGNGAAGGVATEVPAGTFANNISGSGSSRSAALVAFR